MGRKNAMTLTRKERVRRVIQRASVDRLPAQVNYTHTIGDKLVAHLGLSLTELQSAVEACVQTLAADSSGLVLAPSYSLTVDIPLENIDALLAASVGWETY
jgi:hypothetical protein